MQSTSIILKLPALHAFESSVQILRNTIEHPYLYLAREVEAARIRWEEASGHPDLFDEMFADLDAELERLNLHVRPPRVFKDFVVQMFHRMPRPRTSARYVHRLLLGRLDLWRETGRTEFAIPGYTTPPPNYPGADHPYGWGYNSILKLSPAPSTFALRRTTAAH